MCRLQPRRLSSSDARDAAETQALLSGSASSGHDGRGTFLRHFPRVDLAGITSAGSVGSWRPMSETAHTSGMTSRGFIRFAGWSPRLSRGVKATAMPSSRAGNVDNSSNPVDDLLICLYRSENRPVRVVVTKAFGSLGFGRALIGRCLASDRPSQWTSNVAPSAAKPTSTPVVGRSKNGCEALPAKFQHGGHWLAGRAARTVH